MQRTQERQNIFFFFLGKKNKVGGLKPLDQKAYYKENTALLARCGGSPVTPGTWKRELERKEVKVILCPSCGVDQPRITRDPMVLK